MSRYGRPWTKAENAELRRRYVAGERPREIAVAMKRTQNAVQSRLYYIGIRRNCRTPGNKTGVNDGYWPRQRAAEREHSATLAGHSFEDVPESVLRAER